MNTLIAYLSGVTFILTLNPVISSIEPISLRNAAQSGDYAVYNCAGGTCPAWKAIDGNIHSTARSNYINVPGWWSAELTRVSKIAYMLIWLSPWHMQNEPGRYDYFKIETKINKSDNWRICKNTYKIPKPGFPHQASCDQNSLAGFIKLTLANKDIPVQEVKVFGTPQVPSEFFRVKNGEKCPTAERRISKESRCKEAATELDLIWSNSWSGPSDPPGCIYANDGRNKVYFNTYLNASGTNGYFAEICAKSTIEIDVEEVEQYVKKVDVEKKSERNRFLNMTNKILKNEEQTIIEAEVSRRTINALTKFTEKIGAYLLKSSDESKSTLSNTEVGVAVARHEQMSGAAITARNVATNITVDIQATSTPVDLPSSSNFLVRAFLPKENFPLNVSDENKSLIFAIGYRSPKLFPSNLSDDISTVLSISINNHSEAPRPLSSPIRIDFDKSFQSHTGDLTCAYWKFPNESNGVGRWDTQGCWKVSENQDFITCECNHLTNIAVLVLDSGQKISLSPLLLRILEIISITGSSISFVALFVTILLHTVAGGERVRNQLRSKILVQLCISLMILMILFFLFAKNRTGRVDIPCKITSGLVHYFLLVTFMAMGCEAWDLRRSIIRDEVRTDDDERHIDNYEEHHDSRLLYACFAASFLFPFIVVVALMYKFHRFYGNKRYCLVHGYPFYVSVLLPLVVLAVLSISIIFRARNAMNRKRKIKFYPQFKFVVGKLVLFGVTWIVGAFGYGPLAPVFQTMFVVLNSGQGIFILLFVILEKRYRQELFGEGCLCCKKDSSDENEDGDENQEEFAMISNRSE